MDRVDYTELTDLTVATVDAGSFGRRLRKAIVMLMAAIALHVWLIRAPQAEGPSSLVLAGGAAGVAPAALVPAPALAETLKGDRPRADAARVQVRTEFINLTPPGRGAKLERERGRMLPELPVGTSGFLRARAELPVTTAPAAEREVPFLEHSSPAPIPAPSIGEVRPALLGGASRVDSAASAGPSTASAVAEATAVRDAPAGRSEVTAAAGDRADFKNADFTTADLKKQEDTVLRVLLDYKRAYEELDVRAAKALWPSVDDRALERAFRQIQTQQVRFADCGVLVSGQGANARCQVEATYRPKVGSRVVRLPAGLWTFNLARDNDRWQIVNASLQ